MENGRNKLHDDVLLVTSERPIALMPTLIRWRDAMTASEVAKWQQRYRIEWHAFDCRNGGAQRTVRENLMVMERFKIPSKGRRFGSNGLGAGPGEGLRAGQYPVVWAWATHSSFPRKILRVPCECYAGTFSIRGECSSKDGGAAQDHHGHLARIKMELLASTFCVAGCAE